MAHYLHLPEEIVSLICNELGHDEDFATLYVCARSTKSLAGPALRVLYERHHRSFAFNQTEDDFRGRETETNGDFINYRTPGRSSSQQHYFKKWIILWRSIIISSLEPVATYKPYCRYLRILDFRNLAEMLESLHFRQHQEVLYAKPLGTFRYAQKKGRITEIDTGATIHHIGETVIPKATRLEELAGHIRPGGYFTRWVSLTPQLRRTVLFMGNALDEGAGVVVAASCKSFNNLSIHTWTDPDADDTFARFLTDLEPDTLRYLQFLSFNNIGRHSFEALCRHSTLKELHLSNISAKAMENLDALQGCISLEVLHLEGSNMVALEINHHDVYRAVIQWLSSCKHLRDITIKSFVDGPAILAAVAVAPEIKWIKLNLEGYAIRDTRAARFHTALREQRDLEVLSLKVNGEDAPTEHLETMVSSFCALQNLKELILKQVSDEFNSEHITSLALSLPSLEEFWTSGEELSGEILPIFHHLRMLKNLTLFAVTQFDYDTICSFIMSIDPESQHGFQLALMAVDQQFNLTESQQAEIRDLIKTRVGGSFDFVLERALESDDSDSD